MDLLRNAVRKVRGLLGLGVSWAGLWGIIGAGIGLVAGIVSPDWWLVTNPIIDWGVGMALYGFVSGIGFGTVLAIRERSHALSELRLSRVALWGVLGSAAVPLLFGALGFFEIGTSLGDIVGAMLLTAGLGGTFAPAAVAMAKRAALEAGDEPELLEP